MSTTLVVLFFLAALVQAGIGLVRKWLAPPKKVFLALRNHQAVLAICLLTFTLAILANISTTLVFLRSFDSNCGSVAAASAYAAWALFLALTWFVGLSGLLGRMPAAPASRLSMTLRVMGLAVLGLLALSPVLAEEQFGFVAWAAYAVFPLAPCLYWRRRVRHEPFLVRELADSRLVALSAATGLAMFVPIFVRAPGLAEALFSVIGLMLAAGAMASLFLVLRGEYRLRRLLAGPAENIGAGALMFRPGQGLCPICAESGAEATLCCA
ncbi:MAG: hypothetical protein HYY25_16790, partial [Candidatus Wallbacteria bacterium]|nr:hypothetical protein [Candidatus Wallbacteria bacterium]